MTVTNTDSRDFDVQVLEDTVRGHFAGKNAVMNSPLVAGGAVIVNDAMPYGQDFIGNDIRIPYFGVLGEFSDNPEDTAVTPVALKMASETATVARSSLAFEITHWAQRSGPAMGGDPYQEAAVQIGEAATREMDRVIVAAAAATSLVSDVYSATVPVYLDWDAITNARAKFEDEDDSIVGMVVHSRVMAGLRLQRDSTGRPLLSDGQNNDAIMRYQGIPLLVSNRVPLTGSTMGTVTEAGTTPPDFTLSGTPLGAFNLRLRVGAGTTGARGTFTFQFSTDGGNVWSEFLTSDASVPLIDTAKDSLVGINGRTGLTVAIENASAAANNTWSSDANLEATSLIFQKGAATFWFNRNQMALETDKDIMKHNDLAAMHLYYAAKCYRRRRGGARPGVVAIKTNVQGFIG